MNITNEQLGSINKLYKEFTGIDDLIEYDEESGIFSCYSFILGPVIDELSYKEETPSEWWISFNDEIQTSILLNISNFIISIIEDHFNCIVRIIECNAGIYDNKGVFQELLYENQYIKTIKAAKEKME